MNHRHVFSFQHTTSIVVFRQKLCILKGSIVSNSLSSPSSLWRLAVTKVRRPFWPTVTHSLLNSSLHRTQESILLCKTKFQYKPQYILRLYEWTRTIIFRSVIIREIYKQPNIPIIPCKKIMYSFPHYHFLACLLIYLYSFNPIFNYDFKFFLFFCKLSNIWFIDWFGTVLRFYVLYYCIIILCFSYLATWLPFRNKPIDWLIDVPKCLHNTNIMQDRHSNNKKLSWCWQQARRV